MARPRIVLAGTGTGRRGPEGPKGATGPGSDITGAEIEAAKDVAVQAAADAQAVGATSDAQTANNVSTGPLTTAALSAAIGTEVGPLVPPLVVDALAADDTPALAAAAAVDAAVDGLDIVLGTDPGIPVPVSEDEWAEVVTDSAGRVSWGTKADGTLYAYRLASENLALESLDVAGSSTTSEATASLSVFTVDATGRIAEPDATDLDGHTPSWVLRNHAARTGSALLGVTCWGDSLTAGNGGTPYPTVLAGLIPVTVTNRGFSGQTSSEIALRAGGRAVYVTLTGNEIPATVTAVAATVLSTDASWQPSLAMAYAVTLDGIAGTLAKDTSQAWTFTRAEAGSVVPIDPETLAVSTQTVTPLVGQVFWAGRNNRVSAEIMRDDKGMVRTAQLLGSPYLVLGVTNGQDEPSGSAGHTNILAINAALSDEFGPNFFDVRGWLIRHGLTTAGITPTAGDATAISEDRIPPSLMSDVHHLNTAGYAAVASRIATLTTSKGWYAA